MYSTGSAAQLTGYALAASAPPFPVFILGYFINGFGMSLQVGFSAAPISPFTYEYDCPGCCSQWVYHQLQREHGDKDGYSSGCVWCVLGIHCTALTLITLLCLGLGAFCSPLVATQFAEKPHWSFHYLVSLGIALLNTILVCSVLRFRTLERKC